MIYINYYAFIYQDYSYKLLLHLQMHLLKIIVVLQLNVPDYLMVFYQYKFEDLEKLFSFIQIINNILLYLNMSKESIFIFRAHQDQSFISISELTIHLKHYKIPYMLICILLTFLESLLLLPWLVFHRRIEYIQSLLDLSVH